MGSEGFFHRPSSSIVSSCCFGAYQPSSLEEIHSSDARKVPFGTEKTHLETFQLPSLLFWHDSLSVRDVLVFRHQVATNFHVMEQLLATMPVTILQFRPPFASLRSSFVSALTFRGLVHLHPSHHRQFAMGQQVSDCEVKHVHQ